MPARLNAVRTGVMNDEFIMIYQSRNQKWLRLFASSPCFGHGAMRYAGYTAIIFASKQH